MQHGKASMTAMGAAAFRAVESRKNADTRVCFDPYAENFLSPLFRRIVRSPFLTRVALLYLDIKMPGIFNEIVARTRYIDDRVTQAVDDGMTQLVIMGAGYDTRAHRILGLKQKMRVFEIDHPDTQGVKVRKMEKLIGGKNIHVTYVPVDFERQTIRDCLAACGYDPSQKTLFIWEGVTMYISPDAVDETLSFVATQSAKGSGIIFNYCFESVVDGSCALYGAEKFRKYVMKKGEPVLFGIERGQTKTFLKQRGFRHVTDADGIDMAQMVFTGANKGRRLPEFGGIVYAAV